MASLTQWTWVWVDSGSQWRTGRPGILQFMGSQRVRHDWATELNWIRLDESQKDIAFHLLNLFCWTPSPPMKTFRDPKMPVIQFISVTQLCPALCDPMDYSTPGFPVHHQLPESTQTHVHWLGDAIQPSHPLSSPSPPTFNLSQHQGIFKWVSSLHQWPKYWSFSFSINPSNEDPGLISFRTNWLDLLAVQGTLKSLLQHHNSKASILWCSAFFTVQLSNPYMTPYHSLD